MTKRPRWTAEEVAQNLHDDNDDLDDPDEPLLEGSDDDLELDSEDNDTMDVDDPLFDADPALGTHPSGSDFDGAPSPSPPAVNG